MFHDKEGESHSVESASIFVDRPLNMTVLNIGLIVSKKNLQLINNIRLFRERCSNQFSFRVLQQFTNNKYKQAHAQGDHHLACFMLYENTTTANYMKDAKKASSRYNRTKNYAKKYGLEQKIMEINLLCHLCANLFKHKPELENCVAFMEKICVDLEILGGWIKNDKLYFPIGCFFLQLLKLDWHKNRVLLLRITDKMKSLAQLSAFYDDKLTESSHLDTNSCIQWIQSAAFVMFSLARQTDTVKDNSPDQKWSNHSINKVYPLLAMAKVKLDLPEFPAGQKRCLVTDKDVLQAKHCLETATKELEEIPNSSARCAARLMITKAGLNYRLHQIEFQDKYSSKQAALCSNSSKYIDNALQCIQKGIALVQHTNFEELKLARDFKQSLVRCRELTIRKFLLKKTLCTNLKECYASSSKDYSDYKSSAFHEQLYLRDLSDDKDTGHSLESDTAN